MAKFTGLFKHDRFFLTDAIPKPLADELRLLIEQHSGTIVRSVERANYVVAKSLSFQEYDKIKDKDITISPLWIEQSVRLNCKLDEKNFFPSPSNIFMGVFACLSKIEKSEELCLIKALIEHGGGYVEILNSGSISTSITHVITELVLGDIAQAKSVAIKNGFKVVHPTWVISSHQHKRLEDESQFFPADYSPTKSSNSRVFVKCVFFVDNNNEMKIDSLKKKILQHGGLIASSLNNDVTHIVTYHTKPDYLKHRATSIKPRWVLDSIKKGAVVEYLQTELYIPHIDLNGDVAPFEQLVKNPPKLAKHSITDQDWRICITNYVGKPREYLKLLIKALGGNVLVELVQRATDVLICNSTDKGLKVTHALSWKVPCVNHLWLIDVLLSGKTPDVSCDRYQTSHCSVVPDLIDCLVFIAHEIENGRDSLNVNVPEDNSHKASVKRNIQEKAIESPLSSKRARHNEPSPTHAAVSRTLFPIQNENPRESQEENQAKLSRSASTKPDKTPELVDLTDSSSSPTKRRRSKSNTSSPITQRSSVLLSPRKKIRVHTSGLASEQVETMKAFVRERALNIEFIDDVRSAQFLIADKVKRSPKFLQAINMGLSIVTSNWLEAYARGENNDELYWLHDEESEKKFGFSLKDSIKSSRSRKHGLLLNIPLALPSIDPKNDKLTEDEKRKFSFVRNLAIELKAKIISYADARKAENITIVADKSCMEEVMHVFGHWPSDQNVVKPEFVFSAIMRQKLDYDELIKTIA